MRAAELMLLFRGPGRGSHILQDVQFTTSVLKNWVDVSRGLLDLYYSLFYFMEDKGILDINNEIHVYCLQYVFIPTINRAIDTFANSWNRHQLSTEVYWFDTRFRDLHGS